MLTTSREGRDRLLGAVILFLGLAKWMRQVNAGMAAEVAEINSAVSLSPLSYVCLKDWPWRLSLLFLLFDPW